MSPNVRLLICWFPEMRWYPSDLIPFIDGNSPSKKKNHPERGTPITSWKTPYAHDILTISPLSPGRWDSPHQLTNAPRLCSSFLSQDFSPHGMRIFHNHWWPWTTLNSLGFRKIKLLLWCSLGLVSHVELLHKSCYPSRALDGLFHRKTEKYHGWSTGLPPWIGNLHLAGYKTCPCFGRAIPRVFSQASTGSKGTRYLRFRCPSLWLCLTWRRHRTDTAEHFMFREAEQRSFRKG